MTATADTTGLLSEWAIQIQTLINAPDLAHEAMSQIHTTFGELHMRLSEAGELDTAERVIGAYNHALMIYNQSKAYAHSLALGRVVVDELTQQRDDTMRDLSGLMAAIQQGNQAHPALADYAFTIRKETREDLLVDDEFLEEADEMAFTTIERQMRSNLRRLGVGTYQSQRLLEFMIGIWQMDPEQVGAFTAFLNTLS